MRILVLMRGIPASGKSTWIEQMGLSTYALSPDSIRLCASAPVLRIESSDKANKNSAQNLLHINQQNDKQVWRMLNTLLELRLKQGDFTIIDATHTSHRAIRAYEGLVNTYRYRLMVIDFSHVPLDVAIERNEKRGYKSVPKNVLESMYQTLQDSILTPLPTRYNVYKYDEIPLESLNQPIKSHSLTHISPLRFMPLDLNMYAQIHHIGDIHGCFDTLLDYLFFTNPVLSAQKTRQEIAKHLEETHFAAESCLSLLNQKAYYIFLGDYIDRGVQNAQVVRFLLGIMDAKNVCLLEGNHERWLYKWGKEELGINEFNTFTMADFTRNGLTPKDTHRLYAKLRQCTYYTYDNQYILCTHGGLPTLPANLLLISTKQLIYGVGDYEDMSTCAKHFANTTRDNVFQVFGHRNREKYPICVHERSFALEGGVEHNLALRALVLQKQYKPIATSLKQQKSKLQAQNSIMGVIYANHFAYIYMQNKHNSREIAKLKLSRSVFALLQKLRESSLIKERTFGDISSFNFTKEAFFHQKWTNLTCKARGLFIDTRNYRIYARSYDKFFNYKEREECSDKALKEDLAYPVNVFVKENGFLGIVSANYLADSVDSQNFTKSIESADSGAMGAETQSIQDACALYKHKLFISSKSDPTSDFAKLAREVIESYLLCDDSHIIADSKKDSSQNLADNFTQDSIKNNKLNTLSKELKERNLSLVFEIIHPELDPHIIAYKKPKAVLLDGIYNTSNFAKMPFDELCAFAKKYDFECKRHYATLHTWEQMRDFLAHSHQSQRQESSDLFAYGREEDGYFEGYVLEDSKGFMFKYKNAYYRVWKAMREAVWQYLRTGKVKANKNTYYTDDTHRKLEAMFMRWLQTYSDENGAQMLESASIIALREAFLRNLGE